MEFGFQADITRWSVLRDVQSHPRYIVLRCVEPRYGTLHDDKLVPPKVARSCFALRRYISLCVAVHDVALLCFSHVMLSFVMLQYLFCAPKKNKIAFFQFEGFG